MLNPDEINSLIQIVREAGNATMRYFKKTEQGTTLKADFSPVTKADTEANDLICTFLRSRFPKIPIISEESPIADFSERKNWDSYWLVDPLDGTKEFIAGIPEFTVNVALIQNNLPILGFVGVPVTSTVYVGIQKEGAFKENGTGERQKILPRLVNKQNPTFIISRSNGTEESQSIKKHFPASLFLQVGSSLKFIKIAEGTGDCYFRLGGIGEWDTAAGHAVLLAGGGKVTDHSGQPILYGSEGLKIKPFIAIGDPSFPSNRLAP